MIKVGIYNHHWSTLGGGEVSAGSLAEELSKTHSVTLLGPEKPDVDTFKRHLNIDLSLCEFEKVSGDLEASKSSENFDWFINHSFSSRAINRAPLGIFIVMFPGDPLKWRSKIKSGIWSPTLLILNKLGSKLDHFQEILDRNMNGLSWIDSYEKFFAISDYTKYWVSELWGRDCEVLYPPPSRSPIVGQKIRIILSVGRFFESKGRHSKKHFDLIEAFKNLDDSYFQDGWRLVLAGGCAEEDQDYLEEIREAAEGSAIDILVNISGVELENLYSSAAIYWHATGYGESSITSPSRFEHFGISVVEAMSAGAVPVVFEKGGPAEIVQSEVSGLHWKDLKDLVNKTNQLISNLSWADSLREEAVKRSNDFQKERYKIRLHELLDTF
jgi:glycosyltransferase involved in cell wall biosynthesis